VCFVCVSIHQSIRSLILRPSITQSSINQSIHAIHPCHLSIHILSAGRHAYAVLGGADHCAIQDPLPGSAWDFYVVNFIRCHLEMANATAACDAIYGSDVSSLCTAGYMVDCTFLPATDDDAAAPRSVVEEVSRRLPAGDK
jgi:hypothetical protein